MIGMRGYPTLALARGNVARRNDFSFRRCRLGISKTIVGGEALSALNSVSKWAVFDPAKFENGCPRRVRSDAQRTL
jgi:hypothetical protein